MSMESVAVAPAAASEAPTRVYGVPDKFGYYWGTGRRKTSVARVRIKPGSGKITINDRSLENFFTEHQDRAAVLASFAATNSMGQWDVWANVNGGGHTGQAGAVLLGISRALASTRREADLALRAAGYLTRDPREVERKKYGRRKARRRFQFSKR